MYTIVGQCCFAPSNDWSCQHEVILGTDIRVLPAGYSVDKEPTLLSMVWLLGDRDFGHQLSLETVKNKHADGIVDSQGGSDV
jgi:hypothetical protein